MDKVFKIRRRPAGGAAGPPPGYAFFAQLQASKLKTQGSALSTDAIPAPAAASPLPPISAPAQPELSPTNSRESHSAETLASSAGVLACGSGGIPARRVPSPTPVSQPSTLNSQPSVGALSRMPPPAPRSPGRRRPPSGTLRKLRRDAQAARYLLETEPRPLPGLQCCSASSKPYRRALFPILPQVRNLPPTVPAPVQRRARATKCQLRPNRVTHKSKFKIQNLPMQAR